MTTDWEDPEPWFNLGQRGADKEHLTWRFQHHAHLIEWKPRTFEQWVEELTMVAEVSMPGDMAQIYLH